MHHFTELMSVICFIFMLYLCTRFEYIKIVKNDNNGYGRIICVYISLYNKKKNDCSLIKGREIYLVFFCLYYQFDDEYDGANGADIFNFGLAVKPSKRLYV